MGLQKRSKVSKMLVEIVAKLQHERVGLPTKIYFQIVHSLKCWPCSRTGCQDLPLWDFANWFHTFLPGLHHAKGWARWLFKMYLCPKSLFSFIFRYKREIRKSPNSRFVLVNLLILCILSLLKKREILSHISKFKNTWK